MNAQSLKKGYQVEIAGNSIFEMMGHSKVRGRVVSFHTTGQGVSIKCENTGAIETADFDDGQWKILDATEGDPFRK